MKKQITKATIGSYHDYFSYDKNLETGEETFKIDGKDADPDEYRDILNCVFPQWVREQLEGK